MATKKSLEDVSASILAGSEEMFECFCQPCSTENLHVEAVSYCQHCSECLCNTCCRAHRKLAATKHHKIVDASVMSKSKPVSKVRYSLTETCPKHEEKLLEYFCNEHNQLCCSVCVNMQHRSCLNMSYVPEVCNAIVDSEEYKTLRADLDRLLSLVGIEQGKISSKNQANEKYHSQALVDIKSYRQQINELLDKLENETALKISKLYLDNLEKTNLASDAYQSIFTDVKAMSASLEEKATSGKVDQLYIEMKITRAHLRELASKFKDVDDKIQTYSLDQDENIQQMISSLFAMWSLSVRPDDTSTYVSGVNVKSVHDTKECNISGIVVLTGHRMVVSDYDNDNVKLVDMETKKLISYVSLLSKPYDIVETTQNQIAVALGNEKKIEILDVPDVLTRSHTIDTPGASVVGLCYNGSNFIASCYLPTSVKIIDMTGRTLNTFSTNSNGIELFIGPRYIAVGRDKDVVFVTDIAANTVTCMTTDGDVISVYRHDMLQTPHGVAVGMDNVVYVCSHNNHTVHQLSPTGDLIRILLENERELALFPFAIACGDEDGRLYISSSNTNPGKGNCVRLYEL